MRSNAACMLHIKTALKNGIYLQATFLVLTWLECLKDVTLEPELINARFVEYFILYKLNLDMNKYQKNNNKNK